jgi:ABC-type sugar transport system permease subunit
MPVQAFVGLKHYRYFASDPEFWTSFYYGSVYAGVTMVLQLGVACPPALC